MNPWFERLEAFMEVISPGSTSRDSWIRPAEAALVEAEAESEVHEPDAWADYDYLPRPREYAKCPKCNGNMILKHHCESPQMTWHGWAVPAILEVLTEHEDELDIETSPRTTKGMLYTDWCERIAPLIADRIACDPQRAIEALSRKVTP